MIALWGISAPAFGQALDDLDAALQTELDDARSTHGLQGAVLSVVLPDASLRTYTSGAIRAGEAVDRDKVFYYASYTKLLTSIVILQLAEEGLVQLDVPLSTYLVPLPHVDGTLTLRELLRMRATVGNFMSGALAAVQAQADSVFATRQTLLDHLPAATNASKQYFYSDSNHQLLGLVIEHVTGKTGEAVFQERLFQPVAAASAALAPVALTTADMNGAWFDFGAGLQDIGQVSPTGYLTATRFTAGAVGTTADMLRVLAGLFEATYLDAASLAEMTAGSASNNNYGLGVMRRTFGGYELFGHGGGFLNHTRTFYNPVEDVGLALAINHESGATEAVFQSLYLTLQAHLNAVDVASVPALPQALSLAAYPNPTVGAAALRLSLPAAGRVQLDLYNLLGQKVKTLVDGRYPAGTTALSLRLHPLPAGIYFLHLQQGNAVTVSRLVKLAD